MNSRFTRASVHLAALGAAFTAGWGLRPDGPHDSAVIQAPIRPAPIRILNPLSAAPTTLPTEDGDPPASSARHASDHPLIALRSLALAGAATTPIERLQWLAEFAALDPETALTYVDTLPASEKRDATATLMGAWAARDPESAATHLADNLDGFGLGPETVQAAAQAIALAWARQDAHQAVDWAANAPEEIRSTALDAAIGRMTAIDPESARTYFSTLTDPQTRAESAEPLAAQWATRDPVSAAAWATGLATPADRAAALAGVTASWMMSDPSAASRWVAGLTAGHDRDAAIVALVESPALRNDAAAAAAWAATLQDPVARQELLPDALRRAFGQQDAMDPP